MVSRSGMLTPSLGHDSLDIAASVQDAKDKNGATFGAEKDHVRSNREASEPWNNLLSQPPSLGELSLRAA